MQLTMPRSCRCSPLKASPTTTVNRPASSRTGTVSVNSCWPGAAPFDIVTAIDRAEPKIGRNDAAQFAALANAVFCPPVRHRSGASVTCTKCDEEVHARGLCSTHWASLRRRLMAYGKWDCFYVDAAAVQKHVAGLRARGGWGGTGGSKRCPV